MIMQQWNRSTEDTRPLLLETKSLPEKTKPGAMPSNILSSSIIDSENTRHWAIKVRFNSKTKKLPPWGESLQAYQLAFITTKYTSTILENLASTKLRALQIYKHCYKATRALAAMVLRNTKLVSASG